VLRILHIGAGPRGRHWLEIVRDYPEAVSVGLVDPSQSVLHWAKENYPQLPCFQSLRGAVEAVPADAAIIATPASFHLTNTLESMDAGQTVLVEKPFTLSVKEALTVLAQADRRRKKIIVAQNYRFVPAERTLRKLIQEGLLGRVVLASCVSRRYRPGKGTSLGTISYPQLVDVGVHHFDSFRSIFACNAVRISANAFNPPASDYQHGACTQALIEMEGGIHIQYLGTLTSHRYGFSLWIEGEKGVLWTNRKWVLWRPRGKRWFWPVRRVTVPKGDEAPYPREGTTSLLNALRDAVLLGREAETSGEDNLWTVAILEAGIRSDQENREVTIEEIIKGNGVSNLQLTQGTASGA
jgi:predicted dehydrogenase